MTSTEIPWLPLLPGPVTGFGGAVIDEDA